VAIEHGDHLVRERQCPGRQGRIAFVFLVVNRHRPVHRDELLGAVWPSDAPAQTDAALDAFRETAYQLLMKMHAAGGDRAEALRVFARCRELLRDELGVSPSPQTGAVYLEILRAG
jgi:DNA-binding SARP family transcriptional activator